MVEGASCLLPSTSRDRNIVVGRIGKRNGADKSRGGSGAVKAAGGVEDDGIIGIRRTIETNLRSGTAIDGPGLGKGVIAEIYDCRASVKSGGLDDVATSINGAGVECSVS